MTDVPVEALVEELAARGYHVLSASALPSLLSEMGRAGDGDVNRLWAVLASALGQWRESIAEADRLAGLLAAQLMADLENLTSSSE